MGLFETYTWRPSPTAGGGRRHRTPFNYEAYLPDLIAEVDPELHSTDFMTISEADHAVRELNADLPQVAGIEAVARQILRQESVASSRIEGLEIGNRRLARAAAMADRDDRADPTAQEVLGNIHAMEQAVGTAASRSSLSVQDITDIHVALLGATPAKELAGVVRDKQNWLGGSQWSPAGAAFIPPHPKHVDALLEDLVSFLNRSDLPATLQAAIAHAQFETIHPFMDGNGRVGRCLIHVVYRRAELAPRYVPPISAVLATEGNEYERGLTNYRTENGLGDWCRYFAIKTIQAARKARSLATSVDELKEAWIVKAGNPRSDSGVRKLVDVLPGRPVLTIKTASEATGIAEESARRAVLNLEEVGVLKPVTVGRKRNRAWEAPDLLGLLDEFERTVATPEGETQSGRPAPRRH